MRIIILIKYIVLGIIQGITEPLPISSSGHIFILKNIFNLDILNDLNFEIIVNTGSLLAVILIYKNDLLILIKDFFKFIFTRNKSYYSNYLYCILIILGVIPVSIFGFLLKDNIESALSNIEIVGYSFLFTAIILFLSRKMKGCKKDNEITIGDAIYIGLIQIIALIPGISRSGTTFIAGLNRNIERKSALKYSFMMYIPISFGAIILGLNDLSTVSNLNEIWIPYFMGFVFAFVTSLFTLKWFINKVTTNNLKYFSLYCFIISIIVILFL